MASEKKSVAIVGAGPAGLVTARTLLRTGKFDITIFEKGSRIGGLWSPDGYIDPQMTTNLCQFTMSFSSLSWDSVDIGRNGRLAPMYPKAWQVSKYLEEYHRRYIPERIVRFETLVLGANLVGLKGESPDSKRWKITTKSFVDNNARSEDHMFDFLVVASGPFSHPKALDHVVAPEIIQAPCIPIMHSIRYRNLSDLVLQVSEEQGPPGKLLVIGGSHSGSEAATKIALESYSASEPHNPLPYEVIHLTSRRLFALSPLLPSGNAEAYGFEPADFKLYNRSNRPADPAISFAYSFFDTAKHQATVRMMRSISGEDEPTPSETQYEELQLSAVISETYSQMIRSGMIKQIQGTLLQLEHSDASDRITATIQTQPGDQVKIENIAGVVHATGFDAAASISFLAGDVKALLEYDPECDQYPAVLNTSYISQNMKVPNLAIVGFASQYWGVMEMQARAVTEAWANANFFPSLQERENLNRYYKQLRDQIKAGNKAVLPPYPFGDYIGLVEQAARELNLERVDGKWLDTEGPICPARYITPSTNKEEKIEALKAMTKLQEIYRNPTITTAFVARAVFYALLGGWTTLNTEAGKEEANKGEFSFHPRLCKDSEVGFEYLSVETSITGTTHGIYRYETDSDDITIWSTSLQHPFITQECLFKLKFTTSTSESAPTGAIFARRFKSSATVLEREALDAEYAFHFSGTRITRFNIAANGRTVTWFPIAVG